MLEVKIKDGNTRDFKDIYIKNGSKILAMYFMGNLDLYWAINKSDKYSLKESIEIPKADKDIYKLFDELYNNVQNCKIFEKTNKFYKYVLADRKLFNEETNTIEWHSDETYFDSDDIVKIIKEEDKYTIEFTRPTEYEDPFHFGSSSMIYIRFRNSGSYYHPFNAVFMKMFKKAQNLRQRGFEDVQNEEGLEK